MKAPKPSSSEELRQLVEAGDIEILIAEDAPDGTTYIVVCDHRRTYEEGEIYELWV